MNTQKEFIKAAKSLLSPYGVKSFSKLHGGKHPKLAFEIGGKEYRITFPSTSSDCRALQNWLSQLRRTLNLRAFAEIQKEHQDVAH